MRSNRGLSEFASFPILIIIILVVLIVSLLMFAVEYRGQLDPVDTGMQAAMMALLHAERDHAETYLRTALDRSIRDSIGRTYAYRSMNCPLSEYGVPIVSEDCGYEREAFEFETALRATDRMQELADAYPNMLTNELSIEIEETHSVVNTQALVFIEMGDSSRLSAIGIDAVDPRDLPLFMGPISARDALPETIPESLDFEIIPENAPAYCADDPMNKEKAATFVRNTIEYCERQTGTCSCGSVPLPEGERNRLEVRDGEVYLHEYALGIDEDELEETFWIDTEITDRLYVHRNDLGVILNVMDPGLGTCSEPIRTVAIGGAEPLPVDLSDFDIVRAPPIRIDDDSVLDVAIEFPEVDLYVYLAPHDGGRVEYGGNADLSRLIDLSLRADDSIFGFEEQSQGIGFISCVASPYLYDASLVPVFGLDVTGIETVVESFGSDSEVLLIRHPDRTALECGSQPISADQYEAMLQGVVQAVEQAVRVSANPPRTRMVCIDDPIEEWVEIEGRQQYATIYPTVAVPLRADFLWPLERVDDFEGCWGPKTSEGTVVGYHKGIDIQPPGSRVDYGTALDRFTDYAVVSSFEGEIVAAYTCKWTVYDTPFGALPGEVNRENLIQAAGEDCRASSGAESFGEHLVIESVDKKYRAIYAHLAPGSVRELLDIPESAPLSSIITQKVRAGQRLGYVGNTGYSTGAHLHFEIFETASENAGQYPMSPSGGYTAPAQRFSQFNPLCVLPETIPDGGSEKNIWPMFGGELSETEPIDADSIPLDMNSGFFVPPSESDNCIYNYWMAHHNYNPVPETYGVCPTIDSIEPSEEPPIGIPLDISIDFVELVDGAASFLLIVNAQDFDRFTPSVSAQLDSGSGFEPVTASVSGEVHSENRASFIEVALPEDASVYTVMLEVELGALYAPVRETIEFEP